MHLRSPLISGLGFALAACALSGMTEMIYSVTNMTMIQLAAPEEMRGRGARELLQPLIDLSRYTGAAMDAWLDAQVTLTEMHVARVVSRHAPEGSTIFVGNSMPVRDFDMYAAADGRAGRILANRGASGIDGNIATALGAARALVSARASSSRTRARPSPRRE